MRLHLTTFVIAAIVAGCRPAPPPSGEPSSLQAQEDPAAHEAAPAPPPEPPPPPPPPPPPSPPPPPAAPEAAAASEPPAALLRPEEANETAPERFSVRLDTTKGEVYIDVRRSWAPRGADRFYNLVQRGFFDDNAFFRVVAGFMAQVGLHGHPAVNAAWRNARIEDDPVQQTNARGMLSFATSGKNSRTTQFFINLVDNARLDAMGFAPIGRVRNINVVDRLYAEYGEGAPAGRGPFQARIQNEGNAYLRRDFPELDYIRRATITDQAHSPEPAEGATGPAR